MVIRAILRLRMRQIIGTTATAALSIPVLLIACTSGDGASPTNQAPSITAANATTTTFHKDVEPILQRVCQRCHLDGGIAPFSLLTYAQTKGVADSIVSQTAAKTMPPWGAQNTPECTPPFNWKDDLRLSDAEIATLATWHAQGDLEGNAADAPPPVTDRPLKAELTGALKLGPAKPFELNASKDTMQCFLLDPKITQAGTYLNGTYVVPGNKTIVHHAIAYMIPATATMANGAKAGDAKIPLDENTPYECFGGPNVDGATMLAAWAPGGGPSEYPPNVGLPMPVGARIVMQVHYHPHANATKDPDTTQFQYRLTNTKPNWIAMTQLAGNFNAPPLAKPKSTDDANFGILPDPKDPSDVTFKIPANATAHVETMTFSLPETVFDGAYPMPTIYIAGVGAHMHLSGFDEKITLHPKDGSPETCLMQEPAWNFDWQRGYAYDTDIEKLPIFHGGDSINIRCTYNNTMSNPKLSSALIEASGGDGRAAVKDIFLGESTTDEMCIGGFLFLRAFNAFVDDPK